MCYSTLQASNRVVSFFNVNEGEGEGEAQEQGDIKFLPQSN
jgi:hypothetical protein